MSKKTKGKTSKGKSARSEITQTGKTGAKRSPAHLRSDHGIVFGSRSRKGGTYSSAAAATRRPPMTTVSAFGPPGPASREALRKAVEEGLPVDTVKELQSRLKDLGVERPSAYVESIATRSARSRRATLTREEGERLVRVAGILSRALDVWEDEDDAAQFLTSPHSELNGDTPIDRALSEIGARQVEDILLRLDLGIPV